MGDSFNIVTFFTEFIILNTKLVEFFIRYQGSMEYLDLETLTSCVDITLIRQRE